MKNGVSRYASEDGRTPRNPERFFGSLIPQGEQPVVGKAVTVYLEDMMELENPIRPFRCRVVFVHPQRRFYTIITPWGFKLSMKWGCAV